jgi:biotin-(acetyl-CoA carboxylase) ligase
MISIPLIRRKLASDLLGRHIYLFGHGASSTATLRRLADAGAQEGTVVLSAGAGSAFSAAALFRPSLPVGAIPVFSAIATLALAEAIAGEELRATPVWPNQVVVEDETVGRSVVETAPAGDRTAYVILGVDVDLRALENIARRAIDPNVVVAAFLNALDKWSTAYAARGPAAVSGAIQFLPRGSGVRALEEQGAR